MSELYPVLLPFAACLLLFVAWISQQKKSIRRASVAETAATTLQREEVVVHERTAEPAALQTSAV